MKMPNLKTRAAPGPGIERHWLQLLMGPVVFLFAATMGIAITATRRMRMEDMLDWEGVK